MTSQYATDKKPEIKMEDLSDDQKFIMARFSAMIGSVLTLVETAIPEGQQYTSLRRLLNDVMYAARNDFLSQFDENTETESTSK